ncbi:MAG TPA: amidohydrolase [Steroidobacteraceae bacterium]|nr:amidohydrolase [Steroidobacteraceae bacterium]
MLLLAFQAAAADPAADTVFVNGKVWTEDEARPQVQAIAVLGEKILAVGTSAEMRALAGPRTTVIDLNGRLLIPGFQDSHLHFPGPSVNDVQVDDARNVEELQKILRDFVKAHPGDGMQQGGGWTYGQFPGGKPHRKYLDAVLADRPMVLDDRDGHVILVNSKALAMTGVTRDTPDPGDGRIVRDEHGEPTGEFDDGAKSLVYPIVPDASFDDRYEAFITHMDEAVADGLTSAQNASWSPMTHRVVLRALAEGRVKLRLRFATPIEAGVDYAADKIHLSRPITSADLAYYRELRETFPGPLVKFGAIKGYVDGTVDAKTAAMFEPYVGTKETGIPFWDPKELNETVALYDREGFQVMLHAIGDKGISMALDAYAYAAKTNGTTGRRHRVEHIEVPRLSDLPRFKELGVIASTQAIFCEPGPTTFVSYEPPLGPQRASHAMPFKAIDDAGAVQAFGSDWSVFDFAPIRGIYDAVTRMTPEGTPKGGWYPQQRISVEAALRHFTRDGAYASFDENIRGTLTPGKLADLVVLSDDILTMPPQDIMKARVLLTMMGGKITYEE